MRELLKKPDWIKKRLFYTDNNQELKNLLKSYNLNTVCEEAKCPNKSECYHDKTATFLIMGKSCTRSCLYCSVDNTSALMKQMMPPLDENEPRRIAEIVRELNLLFVVITSVARDDLLDGGASHFVKTINEIKLTNPNSLIEVLTPDFKGNINSIQKILNAIPQVYNHNLETIERLTPVIRKQGSYSISLKVLELVKKINPGMITKSGVMLGLGESENEIIQLINDLTSVQCDILTIGQYLQPSLKNYPVREYIPQDKFDYYKKIALSKGLKIVHSSPFVRSSYKAKESYEMINQLLEKNLKR